MPIPQALLERARLIRLVLLDVDGVLTDGRLYLSSDGVETKAFHVRDGLGVRLGRKAGLVFGIVSGRESLVVVARARELGIDEVHQGVADKGARLEEIAERLGVPREAVCFVGDDVVDVPALRRAGLAVAPSGSDPEAAAAAHWITERHGGDGAVREVVDLILHAQGTWERVVGAIGSR